MRVTDLIIKKRNRLPLTSGDIEQLIEAYTAGAVPDYQMSAFLMAAFLNGMSPEETRALTASMLHSGEVLDLSDLPGIKVDKHSTGGVGDKVSLILAPIVAAAGVPVPMISGRSLGHSGGTLDKLESIPGLNVNLSIPEYRAQLDKLGIVMIGQTPEIAPADRKLYALRDVTGTVEFVPFIASSIMSKKLAEGINGLVLDVKWGAGAFMKTQEEARILAETLVKIGEDFGKTTVAWLTDMNAPLGYAVGNWPEMVESIKCLKGKAVPRLMELTIALCGEMICIGGKADSPETGRQLAQKTIDDGSAMEKFREMVDAQGGDASLLDHPERREGYEPIAQIHAPSDMSGFLSAIDAYAVGMAALHLGAGRMTKEDEVDPLAGITFSVQIGDPVTPGMLLAELYGKPDAATPALQEGILEALQFSKHPPAESSILTDRYTIEGWFIS